MIGRLAWVPTRKTDEVTRAIKQAVGWVVFHGIRTLDRLLPVDFLRWVLIPWATLRALFPTYCMERGADWPGCLGPDPGNRLGSRRIRHHLDRILAFLPDRLDEPGWRARCEIVGLGSLETARRDGRPVVLAFCHFGPFVLISHWLRAIGFPVIPLVGGIARKRQFIHRLKDRCLPFPEIPGALYTDQMREVATLGSSAALLVALDVRATRWVEVPVVEGWTFRVATGAIRMAAQKRALLIPCTVLSVGPWRFRIEIGRPVPDAFLGAVPDVARAAAHLVAELFPLQKAHPDHCYRELLGSLRPVASPVREPSETPAPVGGSEGISLALS